MCPTRSIRGSPQLGAVLTDATWRTLNEEIRYALFKLVEPKRNPEKVRALLLELGLLLGPAGAVQPKAAIL